MLRYLFSNENRKDFYSTARVKFPPAKSYPYDGITRIRFIGCFSAQNGKYTLPLRHPIRLQICNQLLMTHFVRFYLKLFYTIILNFALTLCQLFIQLNTCYKFFSIGKCFNPITELSPFGKSMAFTL